MHPFTPRVPDLSLDALGLIPFFLNEADERPAAEQFDSHYGWRPMDGWTLKGDVLHYGGEPPLAPLFEAQLRDEKVYVYDYAWVAIVKPDGTFEVSRMD